MSRRDRIDPETARLVEERLQWLLSENAPELDPPRSVPEQAGPQRRRTALPRRSRPVDEPAVPDAEESEPVQRTRTPASAAGATGRLLPPLASFRRAHLVVVAAIVALGLLLAGWAVLRARPVAVAVTAPPVAASRPGSIQPSAGGAASPSASAAGLVVHVLGAVKKPGLVSLPAGSRVQDALDAAGGLTGKADPGELNLAQPVADGQQITVGTTSKPSGEVRDGSGGGTSSGSASGGSAGGSGQSVNLNSATQAQLEELPGVGPVMAGKIIAWRTENGRFNRVEELQEIDGVGPKTYAKLAPLCRV